ncbi:MAG: hypothetical protein KDA85_08350, partial [Planctomycetaceae bacterium]|nr:hypothetical protein [Planctomycetaceae bacterium]
MIAWLLPLAGFAVEIFGGFWGTRKSKLAAWLSVGCIVTGFICSASALCIWGNANGWVVMQEAHHGEAGHDSSGHDGGGEHGGEEHGDPHTPEHLQGAESEEGAAAVVSGDEFLLTAAMAEESAESTDDEATKQTVYSGTLYSLGKFGSLEVSLDYYIDSLTLVMFTMVTLIASCIHLFAMGYMSEELTDEYVDHHAHTADGHHVHRPGRFYRFFAFLSLFCFSMLGLVLAGNIFQV